MEMVEVLGVSNSFLTYHLENLGELISKTDDGKYKLSSFGEAAMATMTRVEDTQTIVSQQLSRTQPRKVVTRSVAVALGMVFILLIAGLGGTLAYYAMVLYDKESELGSANNKISQLNTSVTNLQDQDKQLQAWLDGNETLLRETQASNLGLQDQVDLLNSNVTNLRNQMNNFHIWNAENSTTWVNNEILNVNQNVYAAQLGKNLTVEGIIQAIFIPSAGYVSVRVLSNNNSTFVGLGTPVLTNINGTHFDFPTFDRFNVGLGGTVVFQVSPASFTQIFFGSVGEATLTVTITYYH